MELWRRFWRCECHLARARFGRCHSDIFVVSIVIFRPLPPDFFCDGVIIIRSTALLIVCRPPLITVVRRRHSVATMFDVPLYYAYASAIGERSDERTMKIRFRKQGVDGLIISFATTIQSVMRKVVRIYSSRVHGRVAPKVAQSVGRRFSRKEFLHFYAAK